MPDVAVKSFRLLRPSCPCCSSGRTRFDWSAPGNLWRIPLAIASAVIVFPAVGLRFRGPECGRRFIASRAGAGIGC